MPEPHSRLVAILADTISQVEGPAKTAIVMTRLLGALDEERRTAAMQLFLQVLGCWVDSTVRRGLRLRLCDVQVDGS